jgi:hypothetical protein
VPVCIVAEQENKIRALGASRSGDEAASDRGIVGRPGPATPAIASLPNRSGPR